jgi:hypothetical protein
MAVMVAGTDLEAAHRTVDACRSWDRVLDSRRRIAIAVVRMRLKGLRFLCNSSRLTHLVLPIAVCWGKGWMEPVGWRQGDHTWRWPGCRCSIVFPRACGRSIGRQLTAWRVGQAVCLFLLVTF